MPSARTRKVGLEVNAKLYQQFSQAATANGQSRRFLLEKALKHYLDVVLPSAGTVRPEVLAHARLSMEKNRELLRLLAK